MDASSLLFVLDAWAAWLLGPLAAIILVSGLDDVSILAAFVWLRGRGRLGSQAGPAGGGAETRDARSPARIAIFVPLWQEDRVIARMLEHNLGALRYNEYDIFAGVYPNDTATRRAVQSVAARFPRVHLALCPHDGPTSKADCLNWIYQRMLLHERETGVHFDLVLTHDAEDLIHPDALALASRHSERYGMVQIPVLPLATPWRNWVHGIYCDDFAESHWKDLPVRSALGGFVPSCGVGTSFRRDALERLAGADANMIFRPDCLTEDYENGYRVHRLGLEQLFLPISFSVGQPVATREFFPRAFSAARRQRTRWISGIVFQGWQRNGWGKTWSEAYWFARDRKGMVGNPASLMANLLLLYGAATWAWCREVGRAWGLGAAVAQRDPWLGWMLAASAAVGLVVLGARMYCSARIYGWRFASLSPVRTLLGNLLNSAAAIAAARRWIGSIVTRRPLVWLKTEHHYPAMAALESHSRTLEEILTASGYVSPEVLDQARASVGLANLAEHLVACGAISREQLMEAQSLRHGVPSGDVDLATVATRVARSLPRRLIEELQVLPVAIGGGVVRLACTSVPGDAQLERLRRQTRLAPQFQIVSPDNLRQLLVLVKG